METVQNNVGIWKFYMAKVSLEQLQDFAQELAKDESYLLVYIRQASQNQWGIGFEYKNGGKVQEEDGYIEKTKDLLYRKFGSALAGWDISHEYYKIK
jgi:hypothetical protein